MVTSIADARGKWQKAFSYGPSIFACQRIAQKQQERKGLNQIKSDKKQKSSQL
jgi:hypothetical protein